MKIAFTFVRVCVFVSNISVSDLSATHHDHLFNANFGKGSQAQGDNEMTTRSTSFRTTSAFDLPTRNTSYRVRSLTRSQPVLVPSLQASPQKTPIHA